MPYSTISRQPFQVEPHRTLEETTYRYLRSAIVAGELAPGAKLIGSRLAEELNVSRITIANALKRLISEGFVVGAPHREAIVASLDEASLREIFLTRYALEEVVMREVVRHVTPAILDQLREIDSQLRLSIADQDIAAYRRLEREYHLLIYAASELPMISALLTDLWDRLEPYRGRRYNKLQLSHKASAEHHQILSALQARDSGGLIAAMRAHVDQGYERFRQVLATANVSTELELIVRRAAARKTDRVPAPVGSLRAALDALTDTRRGQGKVHAFGGVLVLAVCAMLCGVQSCYGVAQWGEQCHPAIRTILGLPHDHGPSVATVHRIFRHLDHRAFITIVSEWFDDHGIHVKHIERPSRELPAAFPRTQQPGHISLPATFLTEIADHIRATLADGSEQDLQRHESINQLLLQMLAGDTTSANALLAQRELMRQLVVQTT